MVASDLDLTQKQGEVLLMAVEFMVYLKMSIYLTVYCFVELDPCAECYLFMLYYL